MKTRFEANANTGPRYKLYNRVTLTVLESWGGSRQGVKFGEFVRSNFPVLYKEVFGDRLHGSDITLSTIFQYLFPNPRCVCCGGELLGKCRFYCTKECSMLHRTGYSNPSYDPKVRAARVETSLRNWGTTHPLKNLSVAAGVSATLMSRTPAQKLAHKNNIIKSNLAKHGVRWNTQNPDILTKVHRSAFSIKSIEHKGVVYEYQGWEDKVLVRLVDRFGPTDVKTQYMEDFPKEIMAEAGTRPDLYVVSSDTFVEVKSEYTFMGNQRMLRSNRRKARNLVNSGNTCRWIVVTRNQRRSSFYLKTLPTDWHTLPTSNLRKLLHA